MKAETATYRLLSLLNDARAISKGPKAIGKRLVRKAAYRGTTSILRRIGL